MCNFPHTMCLCCIYINDLITLDFWYIFKETSTLTPVTNCAYWMVIGSYNNWNIIHLSHKSTPFEAFEEINQDVLGVISDNMASLVQYDKYGAINKYGTTTNG